MHATSRGKTCSTPVFVHSGAGDARLPGRWEGQKLDGHVSYAACFLWLSRDPPYRAQAARCCIWQQQYPTSHDRFYRMCTALSLVAQQKTRASGSRSTHRADETVFADLRTISCVGQMVASDIAEDGRISRICLSITLCRLCNDNL